MNPPKLRLCHLYPATDPQGKRFLKGRIGDLRLVVVERSGRKHEGEGIPTHDIFLIERNFRKDVRLLDNAPSPDDSPKGDE